jgi:hypothetical protein
MIAIHKVFLQELKQSWGKRFPLFQAIDLKDSPPRPKGTNFICDAYLQSRGIIFFFFVEIPPKRSEEITMEITISDSSQKSRLAMGWKTDMISFSKATYRIGTFISGQDFWWALADLDARQNALMESLGVPPLTQGGND